MFRPQCGSSSGFRVMESEIDWPDRPIYIIHKFYTVLFYPDPITC